MTAATLPVGAAIAGIEIKLPISAPAQPGTSERLRSRGTPQECARGYDAVSVSSNKRILRVVKTLRILKIMRLLKGIQLVE